MLFLARLLEHYLPSDVVSPYSLIVLLVFCCFLLNILGRFDIELLWAPIWYDIKKYRLPNLVRKITFQKPLVISRPELLVGGGGDEWRLAENTLVDSYRVTTKDIDLMIHQNNARYLTRADIARFKWLHDSGLFHACWFAGLSPVTASQTIRYRRELRFGVTYSIVTRCVGWDAKAIFIEQLFTVNDEVHAILEVREGISVPKKIKDKFPMTAEAPLTWVMREILKWDKKQVPADEKLPPGDFANWLSFLHDNYSRVISYGSPASPNGVKSEEERSSKKERQKKE